MSKVTDTQLQGSTLEVSSLILDPLKCEATCENQRVKLTFKECQLLDLFMRNRGQVLTKEQIFDRVWGLDTEVEVNNVEIYIHYLRKKLKSIDSPINLETVRGVGYCLKGE